MNFKSVQCLGTPHCFVFWGGGGGGAFSFSLSNFKPKRIYKYIHSKKKEVRNLLLNL